MRISFSERDRQKQTEETINSQRNIIKHFIFNDQELKKANIEEFVDEGYSGSTTSRPGLDMLLKKVRGQEINCIIVKDMSRFMRNYIEMGDYLENIFPLLTSSRNPQFLLISFPQKLLDKIRHLP